jgi:hypothetical protein
MTPILQRHGRTLYNECSINDRYKSVCAVKSSGGHQRVDNCHGVRVNGAKAR